MKEWGRSVSVMSERCSTQKEQITSEIWPWGHNETQHQKCTLISRFPTAWK